MPKLPHGRALRRGRYSEAHRPNLITTVTRDRQRLFADMRCGRIVVNTLRDYQSVVVTLAFVVMPDHLHWLLELDAQRSLSEIVGTAKSVSSRRINNYLGRNGGAVWQRGFHDHAVRREEDLQSLAPYVVSNPVRARLVRSVRDYPLWDAVWV